jgi:HK97 gp10 family phage protein
MKNGSAVSIEGLKELEQTFLKELPIATGKAALRRVGKKALQPVADQARANVRKRSGDLEASIDVSTKLSKRQAALQRKLGNSKTAVNLFVGGGALPHAHLEEFGTYKQAPHPWMRPAWEAKKSGVLKDITEGLGTELEKATARFRKRQAKKAAAR